MTNSLLQKFYNLLKPKKSPQREKEEVPLEELSNISKDSPETEEQSVEEFDQQIYKHLERILNETSQSEQKRDELWKSRPPTDEVDEEAYTTVGPMDLTTDSYKLYATLYYDTEEEYLADLNSPGPSTSGWSLRNQWEDYEEIDQLNITQDAPKDTTSDSLSDILADSDDEYKENNVGEPASSSQKILPDTTSDSLSNILAESDDEDKENQQNYRNPIQTTPRHFSTRPMGSLSNENSLHLPDESTRRVVRPFGELSNFTHRVTDKVHSPLLSYEERSRAIENVRSIKKDIQSIMGQIDRAVANLD